MTSDTADLYGLRRPRSPRARLPRRPQRDRPRAPPAAVSPRWSSTCLPAAVGSCSTPTGYVATVVAGEITIRDDEPTGALPGRLIRGEQPTPAR